MDETQSKLDYNLLLQNAITYYEREIKPYKYVYHCKFGLKLEFDITEDQVCHLLLGSIDKCVPNRRNFIGKSGYNAIKNGNVKFSQIPKKNSKHAKNRIKHFNLLDKLLSSPKIIHYNQAITQKGNSIKFNNSLIKANYLLIKEIHNNNTLHLFIRENKLNLEPVSFFVQKDHSYTENQLSFEVEKCEKILKEK